MLLIQDPPINYGPANQRTTAGTNILNSWNAGDLSGKNV
jgi:hypothetical protein